MKMRFPFQLVLAALAVVAFVMAGCAAPEATPSDSGPAPDSDKSPESDGAPSQPTTDVYTWRLVDMDMPGSMRWEQELVPFIEG